MQMDIIALSEARMYDDIEQLYRRFDSYVSVFKKRSRHGGGLGFLTKRHISFDVVESLSFLMIIKNAYLLNLYIETVIT